MDVRALMVPNNVRELMKAAWKGDVYALAIALGLLLVLGCIQRCMHDFFLK